MPAYNAAPYLEAAVRSVLAQTMPDFELLIIDDCSTDETPLLLQRLAAEDPRIRPMKNEQNSGVSKTRNRGV